MTIEETSKLSYSEYVKYLLNLYGPAKCDYFNANYVKNSKGISRTKEGLECHHIDEDKYLLLSDSKACIAQNVPFECQKADRLVYCDKIEHLWLHYKIVTEFRPKTEWLDAFNCGTKFIIASINDYYAYKEIPNTWHGNMARKIWDKFDEYISILLLIISDLISLNVDDDNIWPIILASYNGDTTRIEQAITDLYNKYKNSND